MTTPKSENQYAKAARLVKVVKLAKVLREYNINPEDLSEFNWKTVAIAAGVNTPSLETRGAVIARMQQEAAGVVFCQCGRVAAKCIYWEVGQPDEHGDLP